MVSSPTVTSFPCDLGEFTLLGSLGEGGSATVYQARWGHRAVALKVVRDQLVEADRRRFLDEARLLMEMSHPGVVKVLAAGTLPDDRPYLVMEELPGRTLAERLSDGPLPLARATGLFTQLCDAVAAMHRAGLIHRDLKPENIMLVEGGGTWHAVLLDFGIAKAVGEAASLTETGQVRGTPAYMAPERFFGTPASVATDVYELAVVYFAMVAGQLPWADSADPEVRLNPARLGELAEVPPALDEEVARALSTRAANRPPDVATLRDRIVAGAAAEMSGALRVTAKDNPPASSFLPAATTGKRGAGTGATGPQPWRQPGGAVTTGAAASGERGRSTATTPSPRRRWPLALALVGAAGAGGLGVALTMRGGLTRSTAATPNRPDPWDLSAAVVDAAPPSEPTPPPVDETFTPARRDGLRSKMSTALLHHARKTTAVFGLALAELRQDDDVAAVVRRDSTTIAALRGLLFGTCELGIAERGDWLTFAVIDRDGDASREYEVIASGPWTRDEVELCLAGPDAPPVVRVTGPGVDGEPVSVLTTRTGPRRMVWLDEHTFLIATYDLSASDALAQARPRIADPSAIDQVGTRTDRHASLWVVGTAAAVAAVVDNKDLAHAFTLRVELGHDGLSGVMAMYPPDRRRADKAYAAMGALVGDLKSNGLLAQAFPELALDRDGDIVRLRARLPARFTQVVASQLAAGMP